MSVFILDSSPSIGNLRSIGMSFSIIIRNPVVRYVAFALTYIVDPLCLSSHAVLGVETMATRYLKALLNSPPLDGLADILIVCPFHGRQRGTVASGTATCRGCEKVGPECPVEGIRKERACCLLSRSSESYGHGCVDL